MIGDNNDKLVIVVHTYKYIKYNMLSLFSVAFMCTNVYYFKADQLLLDDQLESSSLGIIKSPSLKSN